jgi:6-phosphogluconolactonase
VGATVTDPAGTLPIEVFPDDDALAERGAELIADAARAAVAERGEFLLAISGGHTPWPMLARVASDPEMPWASTDVFQVDERVAPDGDPDRNWAHATDVLPLDRIRGAHPMPVTDDDLEAAAERYAGLLPERFDLIHLGIGPDGHTASLVPGNAVLDVIDRRVALTDGEYQGRVRMTLTYPALNAARKILWLVAGEAASDALARLLAGDESIPAGRVARETALVIADQAAAPHNE